MARWSAARASGLAAITMPSAERRARSRPAQRGPARTRARPDARRPAGRSRSRGRHRACAAPRGACRSRRAPGPPRPRPRRPGRWRSRRFACASAVASRAAAASARARSAAALASAIAAEVSRRRASASRRAWSAAASARACGRGDLLGGLTPCVRHCVGGFAPCPRDRLVRARLRAGDLRRCPLACLRDVRRRACLGRLCRRLGLGGHGAGSVRELFRLAGAGDKRRPVQIELGGPLGQRELGRLGVGGELLGGRVGVRTQPDGVVALALGRELGAAGAGGVLLGLRDGRAGPAGHGGDLEVKRGGISQRRQLLAEPLVQLMLGPQAFRGGRVLASCLLKQVTGTFLGGREKQFIPNGPGRLPAARSRSRVAGGNARRTRGVRPDAPGAVTTGVLSAVGRMLRRAVGGAAQRRPAIARVVHRAAARLGRVGLEAVLLLPPGPGRPPRRPSAGAAGPDAALLGRDGLLRRIAHRRKSITPPSR